MQIACEMPGCAEPLMGKVPICAKCRQRMPEPLYKSIKKLANQGKLNGEYRRLMITARNAILDAQATIQESITEAEQELEKKLDELYPPMLVDFNGNAMPKVTFIDNVKFTDKEIEEYLKTEEVITLPFLLEPPPKTEEKPMDAEAGVQAANWLMTYAVLITIALVGALIILWSGSQQ